GRFKLASLLLMWISALFASILGNVATATTFSQIVHFLEPHFSGMNTQALWWALSFGACLGGNLTILGAATNVVAVSVGDKAGLKIGFVQFMKFSGIIVLESLILASIYIWIRYL
ncbi:MAG: sodium:proton antiporter, partial [Fusobacteriaceae bacterium]|nr:sodium:proton antiporter [Fusobacteriaceae bacterium]